MLIALVGNQNSGKTTLFNVLTGSTQHTGNFPGVTVEKTQGIIKSAHKLTVIDLPGLYSITPYSAEETITYNFLINEKPDIVLNIVDSTNIERNLYLTLQLLELNLPVIMAFNMMDIVKKNGNSINIKKISEILGIPAVPISAIKGEGIENLIKTISEAATNNIKPKIIHNYNLFQNKSFNEIDDANYEALANARYNFIEEICRQAVIKKNTPQEKLRSYKIDSVLTHKIFAFPIFLGIMFMIFWFTFGIFGSFLSNMFSWLIDHIISIISNALDILDVNPLVCSLITDGICKGVGSVISFLPTILIMFFFLSMLEDTGYMARIAFVMDKLLQKIGLSGKSFVPMLLGFGCSVPAIMAARTLSSERDRKFTILLIPFMSCSAKLPIYAVFAKAFFPKFQATVMIIMYIMGIMVGILCAILLKNTVFKKNSVPFIIELPDYKIPSLKNMLILMWDKSKDFIIKTFTVILASSVIIWALRTFDFKLNAVSDVNNSMLANLGMLITPLFKPLGFNSWMASTALIAGLTAKEAVLSTFSVLTFSADNTMLLSALTQIFTPLSAVSFLTFTLLYMPCVAAMSAMKHEFSSLKNTLLAMVFQTSVAWIAGFLVFTIGKILSF